MSHRLLRYKLGNLVPDGWNNSIESILSAWPEGGKSYFLPKWVGIMVDNRTTNVTLRSLVRVRGSTLLLPGQIPIPIALLPHTRSYH